MVSMPSLSLEGQVALVTGETITVDGGLMVSPARF